MHGRRPGCRCGTRSAAVKLAEGSGAHLELRHTADRAVPLVPSRHKVTMVVDLSGGADAVWKRIHGNRRSQVRKARKRRPDGVRARKRGAC